jgi:protein-S-isoprenylcysteine O-methyltransferase Ste14
MDKARYFIAVLMIVTMPPAVLLWFVIHPAAQHWRRIGAGWTYTILSLPVLTLMAISYRARHILVGPDLGTNRLLLVLAAITAALTMWIAVKRKRHLTFRILVGLPELAQDGERGVLLTEGIYSRVRHPRYIEVMLGVLAYALFANYVGVYILALATLPALLLVVVLEERELRQRFGDEYADYCARVPRFIPHLTARHEAPNQQTEQKDR